MLVLRQRFWEKMKFNINFGSISNLGKVKEHNTDAVIEFPIANGHVFAVCDGHDGHIFLLICMSGDFFIGCQPL